MVSDIDIQAEILARKIRQYLLSRLGRLPEKAYPWEMFQAVSFALRDEIIINWAATAASFYKKQARQVYYLSMEYLPGRLLVNNITNLHMHGLMKIVMEKLNYNYKELLYMEPDPGLGNGGLGRLASCFLDSLATQKFPATAYGLRYQYGIFEQQIWDGMQIEKPDCWLLNENPWEVRHDGSSKTVKFAGLIKKRINGHGETVMDLMDAEEVRALPFDFPIIGFSKERDFNVLTLRLWSTKESPHNFQLQRYNAGLIGPAAENTALTDVLYPNDNHDTGKRIRLKQEFLLVSASLQDIVQRHMENYTNLDTFADRVRIQINDTHPALVIVELMRILIKYHDYTWDRAWEITRAVVGYTNHTILREALEEWNQSRMAYLLPRQYWLIEKINHRLWEEVSRRFPGDEDRLRRMSFFEGGQIRMAHLAIYGSHKVNGVARLHGEILKHIVFKDFYEMFPEKFTYVTNGVTQRRWLLDCNPSLSQFVSEKIGDLWLTDFSQMHKLHSFASDPTALKEFWEIKRSNKERLLTYLKNENPIRNLLGNPLPKEKWGYEDISVDALFDVQIKRFHEYKRQLMNLLNLIMVYHDLIENKESRKIKRFVIFGGKAAAGYAAAKHILQLVHIIARKVNSDPLIENRLKIVFVENYSVTKAEMIIPAAELSEQISTAGLESSGTGNMKLAINGALTIGTSDGANIEMEESVTKEWWPFSFGAKADELALLREGGHYNPWDIYGAYPKVKKALDILKDGSFAQSESEEECLRMLFDSLLLGWGGERADKYFVLFDLPSYYEMQKKVEELYLNEEKWCACALHNMAAMGPFAADVAIKKYAKEIWGIKECPIDPKILKETLEVYTQNGL